MPDERATIAEAVRESLAPETGERFETRVREQAAAARADIRDGRLAADGFAVGMELEAYVVDDEGRPVPVPPEAFESGGCAKELGLHNVELNTDPDALSAAGLERQASELHDRVRRARESLPDDRGLVLDAMWTLPPSGGTDAYLSDVDEYDGVVVAANMRPNARYAALDNDILRRAGGSVPLSVPGVDTSFPSILVESLATSIQPHLQVPRAEDFPAYFAAAIRTMGPVLALTSNSPFLPADLYEGAGAADLTPEEVVDEAQHETRIAVFEQSINAATPDAPKVRVPRDVDDPGEVVDRLVADETMAPFVSEPGAGYREGYPELSHKRGTYWRWVRAVIGGQPPRGVDTEGDADGGEASIRIEYRPVPTQPTPADVVSVQALVVGLLRGVDVTDHPLADLPWEAARDSFYAAAEDGVGADLAWVTRDGDRTADSETIFAEVFDLADRGLAADGLSARDRNDLLGPLRARWDAGTTPSVWKKERVREGLADGQSLTAAIASMQREYVERAAASESFAEWL